MVTTLPTPSPAAAEPPVLVTSDGSWRRAVTVGVATWIVSRLCVLAGAGVRAAQQAVEANMAGLPQPGSPARLAFETFTLWDARWYMEIVRQGYPHSIPADVTYFQDEARAAFFPAFPLTVRALDTVLPGGDSFAALVLNLLLGLAGMLMVGLLARRLFDDMVAERADRPSACRRGRARG